MIWKKVLEHYVDCNLLNDFYRTDQIFQFGKKKFAAKIFVGTK